MCCARDRVPTRKNLIAEMKKLVLTLTICVLLLSESRAQDPNFSQFYASPLTLNPALTGKFDGMFRVAGNYRNQWPAINNAFTTATVSADMGILKDRIPEYDQFGVGIMGFTDRAGNGALVNNYVGLSVAYHKALDQDGFHQIGAGFQGSYTNKRLDVSSLKFGDQLRANGFTGLSQENFNGYNLNLSYFDLNAGIFYNGSTNGYNNFYAGVSMYHLNRHKEVFSDTGFYNLASRTTFQAGGKIPMGNYNYLHLAANYSIQAKAQNITGGAAFSLNVNNDEENPTNLYAGLWARFNNVNDAIIPYIGLEFGEIQIGATYDINTSSLKTATNSKGGIELSLIYTKKYVDPNMKKLNCPKF